MTVFVTGASGFVGAAVVRALLARGEEVRALVRPGRPGSNLDNITVDHVTGDLRDVTAFAAQLRGCTALYHVAADYRLWARNPKDLYDTNVDGTQNLIRIAAEAGVARIVYTSSVAVLGLNANGTPSNEDTPVALTDMVGHYKRSKFLAEQAVQRLVTEHHAPVVIVNPSTPIGPRDVRPTPTGRIIVEAARGRMPAYVETGLNVAHVDDVAQGHLLAHDLGRVGARYILGGTDMTLGALLGFVANETGKPAPRVRLPHSLVMPVAAISEAIAQITGKEPFATRDGVRMARKHMYFSSAKAERDLSYTARPAAEAVKDAVAWFQANGYLD
jgi:dihydroflavonol-4-reductase